MACIGVLALILAITPASQLCKHSISYNRRWNLLRFMIFGFLLGFFSIGYLSSHVEVPSIIKLAGTSILMLTGVFTWVVLNLCLKSLISSHEKQERANFAAMHDSISSLPNQRMFHIDLNNRLATTTSLTLISIRYRSFHEIVDVLGHVRGENLYRAVAARLQSVNMGRHSLFDLGGCNFALLVSEQDGTKEIVEEINAASRSLFAVDGSSVQMDCHLGISNFPEHGSTTTELLSKANMAANHARETYVSDFTYQPQLGQQLQERLEISELLKRAIQEDSLQLHYQPIFANDGKSLNAVEALLRWPQKDGSCIPTERFVKIAEQERIIRPLSEWVIDAAIRQLSSWQKQGLDINMHINLSEHDLINPNLVSLLESNCDKYEIPARKIVLELSETAVMQDIGWARRVMDNLHELGFQLAIDEFGNAHASVNNLQTLPVDNIKIDRQYVQEITRSNESSGAKDKHTQSGSDNSFATMVGSLTSHFRGSVTASGIDTAFAANRLRSLGCNYLQGFELSHPLSPQDATRLLERTQAKPANPANHKQGPDGDTQGYKTAA